MVEIPEPAHVSLTNDRLTLEFDSLIARRDHVFVFLDDVFTYKGDEPLRGAQVERMCPVSEEQMDRRMERLRDYDESHLAPIYDEKSVPVSWNEWIEEQISHDGRRLVYDPSYEAKYGEKVEELAKDELGYENVAAVECVGGGRAFNEAEKEYDEVYNEDLVRVMRGAEADKAGNFWNDVTDTAKRARA